MKVMKAKIIILRVGLKVNESYLLTIEIEVTAVGATAIGGRLIMVEIIASRLFEGFVIIELLIKQLLITLGRPIELTKKALANRPLIMTGFMEIVIEMQVNIEWKGVAATELPVTGGIGVFIQVIAGRLLVVLVLTMLVAAADI